MIKKEDCKALPNMDRHCFGCGSMNPYGLKMEFYTNGSSVFSWVTVPDHLSGWEKMVHGGVVSTMLDEVTARGAIYLLKSLGFTRSLSVDFMKPVRIGEELLAEGKILDKKDDRHVVTEGIIYNRKGDVCARSTGTFKLIPSEALKSKGISSDSDAFIEWFKVNIQHR